MNRQQLPSWRCHSIGLRNGSESTDRFAAGPHPDRRDILTRTIQLLVALLTLYPRKRVIHLFLDNARYHHAKLVQAWLAQPGCRIKLHFVPAYCPPRRDRTAVGVDAQAHHPQPLPRDNRRLQ